MKKRPEVLYGSTPHKKTGCGKLYVTINKDEGEIFEVFATMGKAGGCASSQIESTGRLISLALRSGVKPEEIIKQIKGISCHEGTNKAVAKSCADAVGCAIEDAIKGDKVKKK